MKFFGQGTTSRWEDVKIWEDEIILMGDQRQDNSAKLCSSS